MVRPCSRYGDISRSSEPGTEVVIENVINHPSLQGKDIYRDIGEHFALYLNNYPEIELFYEGTKIDPNSWIENRHEYSLKDLQLTENNSTDVNITVIEWKTPVERALYLCNADGFVLEKTTPGIHAPNLQFTAYIKSAIMEQLDENDLLVLDEMHPDLRIVMEASKQRLRDHYRAYEARHASDLIEKWRKDDIYPYIGRPRDIFEDIERQVFDVLAFNVNEYLPGFDESELRSKKLALILLKAALTDSPRALKRILIEVLELKTEKLEELAQLLEKTSLSAIINASRMVTDRLDFLSGLELLLFDHKAELLERRQLHKILKEQTWIFGEEYNLSASDESLDSVLNKHLILLGREPVYDEPVLREDGRGGLVDLMLSRVIPQHRENCNEHLIVELKRPSKRIDMEVMLQINSYAFAVANDERFRNTNTRWEFLAISNEVANDVKMAAEQKDRPQGLYLINEKEQIRIWVKSWGEILDACKTRLRIFQQKLEYTADKESGLALLRRIHGKYLPSQVLADSPRP